MKDIHITELLITIAVIVGVMIAFVLFHNQTSIFIAILAVVAVLFLFFYRPKVALYLLAALYPFTLLQFVYGDINVPYVDIVALMLFAVFAIESFVKLLHGKLKLSDEDFPGWHFFAIFIAAAFLSLANVEQYFVAESVKYILRPLIFFYLMYLVLPLHYIKTKRVLMNILRIMFWLGVILAIGGLYEFLTFNSSLGLRRALPYGFGSFFPLGYNHNLLSEALVGILPISFIFFWLEKDIVKKNLYLLATAFIGFIAVLTFSRAGWLAIIVEVFLIIFFLYRKEINDHLYKIFTWIFVLALVPFSFILYYLNQTPIAQGSNLNRFKLLEISFNLFKEHPIIGSGAGTFFRSVEQIHWYIIEYGQALDAHGMFFKVMAETGIIGIIGFFGFLIYILFYIFAKYLSIRNKEWSIIVLGLIIASIGMLVFEWFGTSYFIAKMWFPIGLTLVAVKLATTKKVFNI